MAHVPRIVGFVMGAVLFALAFEAITPTAVANQCPDDPCVPPFPVGPIQPMSLCSLAHVCFCHDHHGDHHCDKQD